MKYIKKFNESNDIDIQDIFQSVIDMLEPPFTYKIENNIITFNLQCITGTKYPSLMDQTYSKIDITKEIEYVVNKCEFIDGYNVSHNYNYKGTKCTIEVT